MNMLIGYGFSESNENYREEKLYDEEPNRDLAIKYAYGYMKDFGLTVIYVVDSIENAGDVRVY